MVGINPGMGAPKSLTIRVFDTQSGMLLRTIALPSDAWSEIPVVVDTRTGRAFVPVIASVPGGTLGQISVHVYVVDTGTAQLLARVTVLTAGLCCIPQVIALDEQGEQFFIVSPTMASTAIG